MIELADVVLDLLHGGGVRYGVRAGQLWIEDDGRLNDDDYALIREHREAIIARTRWLEERHRSDLESLVPIDANTWVRPGEWQPDFRLHAETPTPIGDSWNDECVDGLVLPLMKALSMQIEVRAITSIRPYDQNPRQNDAAVDAVAASIGEFGFRVPVVVDTDGVIICGHTRWKAAQKLGLEHVPVHVATDLSPEQIRAYRIADNKTSELSTWDYDLLPIELGELQACNYDLGLLGFGVDELAKLLDPTLNDGLCDPDDIPEPPDAAITQPGDLWILGNHRLLCGDSSDPADVDRLLDGATIHLVNTDPPYNVKVEPRLNNAIAAGLSSFGEPGLTHHQGFDVARGGVKKATTRSYGPRIGRWPTTL